MSDKSESFEDYCVKHGRVYDGWTSQVWNHQQKKIDELAARNYELKIQLNNLMSLKKSMGEEGARLVEELQAAEEKLTECAANYWKEVENRKAAEEELRGEQETSEDLARFLNKERVRNNELQKKLQAAEEENKILREVVEFYANKDLYQTSTSNYRNHKRVLPAIDIECERGTKEQGFAGLKARQALEKVASDEAGKERK